MKTTPETEIIEFDYNGNPLHFNTKGYSNLTEMCAIFGTSPAQFLRLEVTKRFLCALSVRTGLPIQSDAREMHITSRQLELLPKSNSGHDEPAFGDSLSDVGDRDSNCARHAQLEPLLVTVRGRRGSGTWAHPTLALECARWLSPEVAIACNEMILKVLTGQVVHPAMDHETLLKQEARDRAAYRRLQDERMLRMELLDVPGNVSALAYALAAGLPATRGVGTVAGSLAKRYAIVRGLPMGMTRQSITSRAKRSLVATYPPECLRDAYLHFGYGHEMPTLAVIENRWRPLLPQHHRLNRVLALGG